MVWFMDPPQLLHPLIYTPTFLSTSPLLLLKDTTLEFSWPISRIRVAFPEFAALLSCTPTSCSVENAKTIAALVEELNILEAKIGLAFGVSAFLWLYSSIQGFKPVTVVVTSELPLGSGLGLSVAFCVALVSALLAFTDSVSPDLELVNKWAFEGEKIIHGKPSGIDNTVSAYGMPQVEKDYNLVSQEFGEDE